jgi:hypothetical protein
METYKNKWTLGEIVTLDRKEKLLKESGSTIYERFIRSRYICIREANEGQRGILMKVLGKTDSSQIRIVNGQPFCMDDYEELFEGDRCFSFPFPSANEVKEALGIIRYNQSLLQKFENASMHINPNSTFWVNDITRNMLFMKKPQYYSARDGRLSPAKDNSNHYRITFVYFREGELTW